MSRPAPDPPDRLLTGPFLALVASSLVFFVAGGMMLPVAPLFATGPIGVDAVGFGLSIGVFSLAALAVRPAVGWSADRFGRRPLLVGGALLTAAATAFHLGVDSIGPFVAVRALLGVAEGAFLVAMLSGFADLAPPRRTGEALSLGSAALWTGVAIGPMIGETLRAAGSFAAVWVGAALLALVAAGLVVLVPETRPGAPQGAGRRGRLFHPAGLLPGVLVLSATWGMAGFLAFVPLHAQALGASGAGPALGLYGGIVLAIRLGGARLPDRIGPARLSAIALAIIAGGLVLLGTLPGFGGLLVGTAVFAVGIGLSVPSIMALAIQRAPAAERGSVVGTASVFLDLSFGLAPVVLAPVAREAGTRRSSCCPPSWPRAAWGCCSSGARVPAAERSAG
jgi:MFS family permease